MQSTNSIEKLNIQNHSHWNCAGYVEDILSRRLRILLAAKDTSLYNAVDFREEGNLTATAELLGEG